MHDSPSSCGRRGSQSYSYNAAGNRLQLDRNATTVVLRPNGAGSSAQWTPVGCTPNWQCVDESTSDGDTTRVETSTPGAVDSYALQDLAPASATIVSVTVTAIARDYALGCNQDPTLCGGDIALQVNGYTGTTQHVGYGYAPKGQTWTTNPATGKAWMMADVNALEAGIENVYLSAATRVTQVYVVVNIGSGTTYAYGPMNELTSTTGLGLDEASYTYDANGNLATKTSDGVTWTYTYNGMGLLKEVKLGASSVAQYFYDGLGRRVKTVEGSATTFFVYGLGVDPIHEKSGTTETRHVYADGMRIAKMVVGGATYYVHADALSSTWRMTDSAKTTVFSTSYEPFGRSWGTTGSLASTERYRFAGERNDTESGLVYLRARQYDPRTGRFTSLDPVFGSLSRPQIHDRYAYVANNPLKYTDPSGMDFLGDAGNAIVGGAVCTALLPFCAAQLIGGTADWLANRASWQEKIGFALGLAFAFAAGFAVAFAVAAFCVATLGIGCVIAAVVIATLVGSVVAGATYAGVTKLLGGTPTREGFDYSFAWGGIVGGIGGGLGAARAASRLGPRPVYDQQSDDHVRPHHDPSLDPYASQFRPGEGGQDFATEVYQRARGRPAIDPKSGNLVYFSEDMGRVVGEGYPGGDPSLGPWAPQRGGTVVVAPLSGRVITQFPGLPRWLS
jgi:RHS repeat-associated protein